MISVMTDFEIDRNPTSSPDLSFFGMESPKEEEEEERIDPTEPEISEPLDLTVELPDLAESRVSVSPPIEYNNKQRTRSPPRVAELDLIEAPADMNGLATGDMVWGKVKSHPWWPGHIFKESFASPSVRRTKRENYVLVAFFGDSSYGWFDPAELIPFEPHFVEKSRQTISRSFINAVDESIDESSRRAALGLSCRCGNPRNFRPARVANYFEVDVVGYERNGIYSRRQITRERESYDGGQALGFLRQLAVNPIWTEPKEVNWYRSMAVAMALRRRMFREFDPTYAEAFGQKPVLPVRDEMGVLEQAENFAPRVAPLSGPLVIAESLGDRRRSRHSASASSSKAAAAAAASSSSSSHKEKSSLKKNKYVLKRRDKHPTAASSSTPSLPDAFFAHKQPDSSIADDKALAAATGSSAMASDYVLQKRNPIMDIKPDDDGQMVNAESPQTPPLPSAIENDIDAIPAAVRTVNSGSIVKKEKKIKKRSIEDVNKLDEAKMRKKNKKHRDSLGQDMFKKTAPEGGRALEAPAASRPESPTKVDPSLLEQLELTDVVADLKLLALNPFYGIERNAPLVTRHVLRRFRSLVYSKSLVTDEGDTQGSEEVQPSKTAAAPSIAPLPNKEAKEQQQLQRRDLDSSSAKPAKTLKRLDDPTKAGRKRAPSDRQEETSAKRMKKVNRLKLLASEKKAALNQKTSPDGPKSSSGAETPPTVVISGPLAAEPAKKLDKQEPPLPRRESPTILMMKFPPRSTLPSVANLKARFARFGPLEVDSTRVFWKSHSCRVQFKYKSDALKALSYCKSNDIFGQIQVDYSIREVEAPVAEPPSEPPRRSQADGILQFRPGSGSGSSYGDALRPQLPQSKLKSILKKPGDDPGKESQRVKFMLSGNGGSSSSSKMDSPPYASSNSVPFADVAPARLPPASRSTSFQLTPPPSAPQPRQTPPQAQLPLPSLVRSSEPQRPQMSLPPPPPLRPIDNRAPPAVQFCQPQNHHQQELQYGGGGSEMKGVNQNNTTNVDISHKMLSLLVRCNDIMTSLRALPDFVPYRPL